MRQQQQGRNTALRVLYTVQAKQLIHNTSINNRYVSPRSILITGLEGRIQWLYGNTIHDFFPSCRTATCCVKEWEFYEISTNVAT